MFNCVLYALWRIKRYMLSNKTIRIIRSSTKLGPSGYLILVYSSRILDDQQRTYYFFYYYGCRIKTLMMNIRKYKGDVCLYWSAPNISDISFKNTFLILTMIGSLFEHSKDWDKKNGHLCAIIRRFHFV